MKKSDKETKILELKVQKRRDLIFYISWFFLPCLIYFFGLIVINGNSILLSFKTYENGIEKWAGVTNFIDVIHDLFNEDILKIAFKRSIWVYFVTTIVTTVAPLLFSYYVYKKLPGHNFFRIVLFLPSLISYIVTLSIFKTMANWMVPDLAEKLFGIKDMMGLVSNPKTAFGTALVYNLYLSFSGGLLMNLAIMIGVDESAREAAHLDGVGFFQEFWFIVLPACYKVLSIGLVTSLPSLFTNDVGMYGFFGGGGNEDIYTVGYYFFIKTLSGSQDLYPYLSAWGLMVSAICIPVTLIGRHLVNKYGPSEE